MRVSTLSGSLRVTMTRGYLAFAMALRLVGAPGRSALLNRAGRQSLDAHRGAGGERPSLPDGRCKTKHPGCVRTFQFAVNASHMRHAKRALLVMIFAAVAGSTQADVAT